MTRLIVVTLLLAAVAIVLRVRNRKTTTLRAIKVTSRVTISRGSMIAVVEVDGRRLLVGAAPNQVNLITELDAVAPEDPSLATPLTPKPFSAAAALAKLTSAKGTDSNLRTGTLSPLQHETPRPPHQAQPPQPRPMAGRGTGPTSSPGPAAGRAPNIVDDEPTTLVDRVRRMTTRTVEPRLRLPNQPGGAT